VVLNIMHFLKLTWTSFGVYWQENRSTTYRLLEMFNAANLWKAIVAPVILAWTVNRHSFN
jgi:hypothetical protein